MGNLTIALVFVVTLNVLMFLTQSVILDLNPEAPVFWNNKGTILEGLDKTGGTGDPVLDTDKIKTDLPSGEGAISPETGAFYTDTFSSKRAWWTKIPGLEYLYNVASAPYNILKAVGLPNDFVFAIGGLWYAVTFFLIVAFFWGGGD